MRKMRHNTGISASISCTNLGCVFSCSVVVLPQFRAAREKRRLIFLLTKELLKL